MALNRHHSKEGGVVVPNAERYRRAGADPRPRGKPCARPAGGERVRVVPLGCSGGVGAASCRGWVSGWVGRAARLW